MKLSPVQEALRLASWGFNVIPAVYKDKNPLVKWTTWQARRTDEMLSQWFSGRPSNFWVMGGSMSGVVILDIDNPEADRWWRSVAGIGAEMDRTTCVRTSVKARVDEREWWGHHYYFRIPAGRPEGEYWKSWSNHPDGGDGAGGRTGEVVIEDAPSFDVRGDGTGVIAPPSIHESGSRYEWVRSPEALVDAPECLEKAFWQAGRAGGAQSTGAGSSGQRRGSGAGGSAGGVAVRSMLADLLQRPVPEGGRNQRMTQIAGHLAKHHRGMKDAYEALLRALNQVVCAPPLDDDELTKTIESIWSSEQENHPERAMGPDSGFLGSGDYTIVCSVKVGDHGDLTTAEYANFDLDVQGVIDEGDGKRAYDVVLLRKSDRARIPDLLTGAQLADSKQLETWLADRGVSALPPEAMVPRIGSPGIRLRRYLEAQGAPISKATDHLGWHPGLGFVTFDSIITGSGRQDLAGVRPASWLRGWGDWRYGFEATEQEALDLLRWVMELREEQTVAVFAAWLTAVVCKGQYQSELFPMLSIESSRETGKSTGFFALMLQLFGNAGGPGQGTYASVRDEISSNGNGVAWLDDLTRIDDQFGKLLRETPVEGTVSKKANNNKDGERVRLRSGLMISGEGLGSLGLDPALLDRFIRFVELPSPKSRMSRRFRGQPQLADLRELRRQYPGGLSSVAGWIVSAILRTIEQEPDLLDIGRWETEAGRIGTGNGVLRLGAAVLARSLGTEEWVQPVDEYCAERSSGDVRTFFESTILPYLIRDQYVPNSPKGLPSTPGMMLWLAPDTGQLCLSVGQCADRWLRKPHLTERDKQLGHENRIGADLQAMGAERVQVRVTTSGGASGGDTARKWFRVLSKEVTSRVLEATE